MSEVIKKSINMSKVDLLNLCIKLIKAEFSNGEINDVFNLC